MRLLTWNVHGLRDAPLDQIVQEIARQRADVACLNEVPRRYGNALGRALGARAFVAGSCIGPYGNVIVSRSAVTAWRRVRFPGTRRVDRRDAAVIQTGGFAIAAVHLNLRAPKRLQDVRHLMSELPQRSIVAGDMNERPDGAVWRALSERYADACPDGAATFPAAHPQARIDAVWIPAGVRVIGCEVIETTASDHRAVVVEIEPST